LILARRVVVISEHRRRGWRWPSLLCRTCWSPAWPRPRCRRSSCSALGLFPNQMGGWPPRTCSRLARV